MRVAKAPLRVSLFGGGTDLPDYCSAFGSTIVSFAISRYMYLVWNERPTGGCRLTYSEVEEPSSLTTANHTLVKAAAERYRIPEPCTLSIISDVPKGTGLGSSSVLAVLLTKMFGGDYKDNWRPADLAQDAFWLERDVSNAGLQDHLPAVHGGFNVYSIMSTRAEAVPVPIRLRAVIQTYGLLLYTERTHEAAQILTFWRRSAHQLHEIAALAREVVSQLPAVTPQELGHYLHRAFEIKCEIPAVVDDKLLDQYDLALKHGALGGKLLGAGGGGCWFFMVPPYRRDELVDALELREIPFHIPLTGVKEVEV